MAQAAAVAGVASVASLALTAGGDITKGNSAAAADIAKGQGTQAANNFQAARAERAAQFGEVQANLTDATMRENLNTTLGNIEAVRTAAGIDPTSPTTAALMDRSESLSDRQRMAAVGSIKAQNEDDLASADYLRRAGDFAVRQSFVTANSDRNQGYLSAATDVASGVAKAAGKGGFGG